MAIHANRNWMPAFCLSGIQIFLCCSLSPTFANQELTGTPLSLLEQHRTEILQLSSDTEAHALFQSITKPRITSTQPKILSQSSLTGSFQGAEIKEAITTYLASLAATAHAQEVRKSILGSTPDNPPSSETPTGEAQLQWIIQQSSLQALKPLMNFYEQVSAWSQANSQGLPSVNGFSDYASYYDRTYPDSDDSPLSWTTLLQEHGQKGIEGRLLEYWQAPDHLANHPASSPTIHQTYAQRYIGTRLLPMFQATLLTQSIQVEATAYETAWKAWHHIQQWQQKEQTQSATTRLCGTWQWLVHNHQNHGDHKMTITFGSPDQSSPSQLEPTTIAIQGDTVYIKWTFPQGIQEDSLLLSNHDTHLEGTFKNSLGPHGSISGKRLSTCRS